jgi:hypothetical protein
MVFMYQGQSLSGGGSVADENVKQIASDSSNANYEMLFSGTADNTTRTEEVRKGQYFTYNPAYRALTVGTRNPNYSVGYYSVVIGSNCAATNSNIAIGMGTRSSGEGSLAQGVSTYAGNEGSHAEGLGTRAHVDYQHTEGKYNVIDVNDRYAHIIGNGTADNARSDAFGVRWDGQLDVYNDIVRQDTNGTWDGTHASLEDAFGALTNRCSYDSVNEDITFNYDASYNSGTENISIL